MTRPTILFLHGNVGVGTDWNPIIQCLSRIEGNWRMSAPDLWQCPAGAPDTSGYSEWVEWCSSRWLEKGGRPVIVGYSLGGRLALHALLARPEAFAGGIMISTNTGLVTDEERAARIVMDREWGELARTDWRRFLNDWNAQSIFTDEGAAGDRDSMVGWRGEIASAFTRWSLGRQANLLPRLAEIKCPILWVSGQHDVRFSKIAAAAASIPHIASSHEVVAGAGHRVPFEKPEETARLIAGFIQGLAPPLR